MSKYEVKPNRYRLVCRKNDVEKVLNNLKKYDFLHLVDTYDKSYPGITWTQIIIDSDKLDLDIDFVNKFNKEVDKCLGTFEEYDTMFD